MEEGVLCLLHTNKLLNIVNDEHINALIEIDKVVNRILAHRVSILHLKEVCRYIQHALLGVEFLDFQANSIRQVSLTHTRCTIEEQGVKHRLTRFHRNALSRRTGQTVAQTLDKVLETIVAAQHWIKVLHGNGNTIRSAIIALLLLYYGLCWFLLRLLLNGQLILTIGEYAIVQLRTCTKHTEDDSTQEIHIVFFNMLVYILTRNEQRQHLIRIRCRLRAGKPRLIRGLGNVITDNSQALAP